MNALSKMLAVITLGFAVAGCIPQAGQTRVVAALSAGSAKELAAQVAAKANVDIADIQSLTVTVTAITLDKAREEYASTVFSGAMEVDLLDLTATSQVISNAVVAPGTYTKIRLDIENPRLRLTAAPEVELTNIHLTANGRLFVSQSFDVPQGQTSLILLDFGGVHLVQQGNGNYTLTPQLTVDLSVLNADVIADGSVVINDLDRAVLTINLGGSNVLVDYAGADIYLADDIDLPSGVATDLSAGTTVRITGILQADGSIVADAVFIL